MKSKGKENSANESSLELKYCERCGGLWLRPTGGGQVYCVACAQAMGELPPASYQRKGVGSARMPQGPRWGMDDGDDESYEKYRDFDLNAAGGVA
jgi:Zn-finger nucleic acid-binding protein